MFPRNITLWALVAILFTSGSAGNHATGRVARERQGSVIRVALLRHLSGASIVTVRLPFGGTVRCDDRTLPSASGDERWSVEAHGDQVSVSASSDGQSLSGGVLDITPAGGATVSVSVGPTGHPTQYRGGVSLRAHGGTLLVVNELSIESYLRGVIAREMPSSAPPAALEAQAIAARTHALFSRGRFRDPAYDVRDTTDTQVYGGVDAETPQTDAAVKATEGLVLSHGGALVSGEYSADCGGVTAAGDEGDLYPPSVADRLPGADCDLCASAPQHEWRLVVRLTDVARALGADVRSAVGSVSSIRCAQHDASGRVRTVEIGGARGVRMMDASALRRALGYSTLRSTLFTVSVSDGQAVFKGKGYGHGRGMCQWGAIALARPPFSWKRADILDHYFPGVRIVPVGEMEVAHAAR